MRRIGTALGVFMLAGMAMATDHGASLGTSGPDGWKDQWIRERNAIIESTPDLVFDPTSILVQFSPTASEQERQAVRAILSGDLIETWDLVPGLEHLAVTGDVEQLIAVANDIAQNAGVVDYAEPDFIMHVASTTPNDTYYSLEWGLNNTGQTVGGDAGVAGFDIDANLAWDVTTGSSSVVVGCIDTGIRKTHEDLAANIWTNPGEIAGNKKDDDGNGYKDDTWGWNFYANTSNPNDDNGHGSHTAGTVGASGNNGKGIAGVAWNCKLAALKFLSRTGSGATSGAISAINYCVGKGIKLSNNSWGGPGSSSLQTAIANAGAAGHLLVVAAGNGGSDGVGDNNDTVPTYPASYTNANILVVAAINNDGGLASFSNYGPTSCDVGAPGVMVASCYNSSNTSYVYMDGTSMACPHVTGVAALVWSRYPAWTFSDVKNRIMSTTTATSSLSGKCVTGGRVNASAAVQ